jgi:hypothetical protein
MAKRTTRSTTSKASGNSVAYSSEQTAVADRATDMGGRRNDATRNESMGSEPGEEEIRMRAYRRYLERGGADGQDFDDWLEAERELKISR